MLTFRTLDNIRDSISRYSEACLETSFRSIKMCFYKRLFILTYFSKVHLL